MKQMGIITFSATVSYENIGKLSKKNHSSLSIMNIVKQRRDLQSNVKVRILTMHVLDSCFPRLLMVQQRGWSWGYFLQTLRSL